MLPAVLWIVACGTPPMLDGKVVDVWGNPIEGATVMMVGQTERPLTDPEGNYHLTPVEGRQQIKAGREGYIQDSAELEIAAGKPPLGPTFQLYPKPSEYGFYVVGPGAYSKLEAAEVVSRGNILRSARGLREVGEAYQEGSRLRVLFHTELKLDEIMRLGLELHKLKYMEKAELTGPIANQTVDVDLWISEREVPVEVKPLRSRTDYLIASNEELQPGYYAFQTQGLLDPKDTDRFNQIPEELRVVFPFEVR
jgi:hypothetical protein